MLSQRHSIFGTSIMLSAAFLNLSPCLSLNASAMPVEDPASAESNIFSSPRKGDEIPRYVRRDRQQMNRRMMGEIDGIPGWQELKVLPSLNPEQRKKIHELYEQSKRESEPLVQELKDLRQKPGMQQQQPFVNEPFAASKARGAFGGGDFRQARIQRPQFQIDDRANAGFDADKLPARPGTLQSNLPEVERRSTQIKPTTLGPNMQAELPFGTQRGSFRMGAPINQEQIVKVRNLQRELRNKRQAAWDQVKVLLTEQNLKDLEMMRKGELLPESLKADSTEPASSSLSKQSQPDFPPMMMTP